MLAHPQHADAVARGALCESCPLYGCGQGPVVPRVVLDSDVLVIEESPSQKDVDDGHPLSGNSGALVFDALAEGDVPHARTSTTSVTLCRPPGGHLQAFAGELRRRARGTKGEAVLPETCCAPRLATDLREARPKLVLTLGSEALRAAARLLELPHGAAKSAPGEPRVATLSRQHGAPVLLPEVARPTQVLLGTFHPRFIFAGNTTYLPIVRADIRRAATLALRARGVPGTPGAPHPRLLDWETPQGILTPSADVSVNVLDALRRSGQLVTVDVETDGIHTHVCNLRCVGLGATIPGQGEVLIVVPWQRMDGRPWWTPAEQVRVGRALGCLEHLPLSGHNLAFDSAVLLRHGFLRARGRHWIDSLVLHHNTTLSELPHDLGFVSSRYFDAPHWKDDADAKAVDGVTDYWLHKYCLYDVASTMRLIPKLIDAVHECGTERSFAVDTKLGPIARDMGTLGLHFDEKVRRQFFLTLEAAGKERLELVRRIVGRPDFNPGSFRQVAHYLFQEKGLSPPLSTTGEEWGDFLTGELQASMDPDAALDKAATNEPALLKLLDLGVDKQTEAFIEALLSYRGVRKCQSTYLGLKRDEDTGHLQDVFRTRGVMQTETHGPGLENLSILHPAWRVTGTVSGRWSSQPNCFDGDTEVLTRRGWVRFQDCEPETDEVAQAWVEDGRVEFVRPTAWVKKHYEGELLHITTKKQIDLCCTPDHRVPFQHRRTGEWTVQPASSWLFDHCVRQAGRYTGGTKSLSPALVTLLCATQADGSLDPRACCIDFSFSKTRKIKRLLGALRVLGVKPKVTKRKQTSGFGPIAHQLEVTRVYVPSHPATKLIRELLGPAKVFGDWILDLDRQTLDLMAEEVWLWDGCASRRSMFASAEKINADWVQIITMLSGRRAKVRSYFPEDAPTQRRVSWQVDATNQDYSMTTNASVERVPHNGFVWCVSVPSDTIITRKNGRVLFVKNCQNFPERVVYSVEEYRASKGKSGILNTRAQVTAPPGYVLVGADYKAVELRLYAVQSGDAFMLEALAKGLDPHALNYATMQSAKIDEVQKWYKRVQESDGKVKKYLRNIAKRFCIAEGELVLTLDVDGVVSETPIERVKRTDKVWDGVEWVTHDGVIFQGVKEVIFHDGLWATEDHEVFLEDGRTCAHGEAQRLSLCLARGGEAGRPLRFMGSSERGANTTGVAQVCIGEMPQVSAREGSDVGESEVREVFAMPGVLVRARRVADVALESLLSGEAAVRKTFSPVLERLRRARHRVSVRVGGRSNPLRTRTLPAEARATVGPYRQQWALRTWEHSFCDAQSERSKLPGALVAWVQATFRFRLQTSGLALSSLMGPYTVAPRMDSRRNHCSGNEAVKAAIGVSTGAHRLVGGATKKQRRQTNVYDILNAGSRKRFTVSNRVVHNCFGIVYGSEREKLYSVMSADRNPDGSRSFPDLKPADVQRWWNNWHKTHPETKRWQQRVVREFMRDGYVSAMIDGRKRFCVGGIDPNAACNHTIQSSAAAITNRALVALAERCPFQGWGPLAGPILQVHDFLCLQVPLARQAEAEALLEEHMPYVLPDGFRFDIERKSGAAWSDI